jgi:inner membrane protein
MDNLTHSLIGAAIGQTGLKKLSGLGMATLIIAANVPDIDAACFLWLEGHEHLAFRRGITHGPPAMLILPALLTAAMIGFDRWQTRRGTRPDARLPVRPWQLFLLALIGCLSHPAFDWLNNYGVRLLEPFSSRWFYGDTLFIIDVWLWAILIIGWFWSRRAEKSGGNWMRRGQVVATLVGLYVFANGVITGVAEARTERLVERHLGHRPTLVVANAVPFEFWNREMAWRLDGPPVTDGGTVFGDGRFGTFSGVSLNTLMAYEDRRLPNVTEDTPVEGGTELVPDGMPSMVRANQIARQNGQVRAVLFWSRMPVVRTDYYPAPGVPGSELHWMLTDQRYTDPRVADRFSIRIPRNELP